MCDVATASIADGVLQATAPSSLGTAAHHHQRQLTLQTTLLVVRRVACACMQRSSGSFSSSKATPSAVGACLVRVSPESGSRSRHSAARGSHHNHELSLGHALSFVLCRPCAKAQATPRALSICPNGAQSSLEGGRVFCRCADQVRRASSRRSSSFRSPRWAGLCRCPPRLYIRTPLMKALCRTRVLGDWGLSFGYVMEPGALPTTSKGERPTRRKRRMGPLLTFD